MHGRQPIHQFRISLVTLLATLTLGGCLGGEEGDDTFVEPPTPSNAAPVIAGSPRTAINIGDTYSFTPTASDADGDELTFSIENRPVWATFDQSTGELSGQPTLANVGVYSDILVRVSDGAASGSLPLFSISVNQMGEFSTTLNWTAPTLNEDGTDLTDLAGYKIYRRTTQGDYTQLATVDNPTVTTYIVENLSAGTYEFVATSYNTAGVESRYSGAATKVLP